MGIQAIMGTGVPGDTLVAIVANDENCLRVMTESEMFDILIHAGISFEFHIISPDYNPDDIDEFCREVNKKDKVRAIITVVNLATTLASEIKSRVKKIIPIVAACLDDASQSANINKPKGTAIAVFGGNGLNACYNATMHVCEIVAQSDPFIAENLEQYAGIRCVEKSAQFCINIEAVKKMFLKGSGNR